MLGISSVVQEVIEEDDLALEAAQRGWLNLSAYARSILPVVQSSLKKEVQLNSIITALSRVVSDLPEHVDEQADIIQRLAVHANLEGITYERSESVSLQIRDIYQEVDFGNKTYLTVTQGINEITVIAESQVANVFRKKLKNAHQVYDRTGLVGITVKLNERYLRDPNLIFAVSRRLAQKSINIVEIVSTATELTYVIEKSELSIALEQLQKDI